MEGGWPPAIRPETISLAVGKLIFWGFPSNPANEKLFVFHLGNQVQEGALFTNQFFA